MIVPIETVLGETPSAKGSFGFRFMAPLCLGSMLNPVNSTMISTALVAIARDFQATVAETGLLIGGLYITSAIAQPTMGRLADRFGARRVFLAGLYLVALAGVAGTFAPSLRALIWVRVLLGVGTSAAYPTAMRILRNRAAQTGSVEPRMALGILSMSALSTVTIGAALGGILTGLGGWRMVFTVNVPLALLGILLVFLWIPEDEAKSTGLRKLAQEIDVLGIVLFAGLLLTGMFFLMSLGHPNWPMLAVSVLLGFVLTRHSLRTKQPFLNIRMLGSNIPLSVTYLRYGAINLMNYCMLYGFSQWLQTGPGFSGTKAGLITLPMSALAALSALAGGRMKSIRNPLIFGTLGLLFGLPQGICSNANQAAVYVQAPHEELGTAAGLLRTSQYVGAMVASSLLGLLFGKHPTDHGMHTLAWVMVVLSAGLVIATVADRTLPREALPREAPQLTVGASS